MLNTRFTELSSQRYNRMQMKNYILISVIMASLAISLSVYMFLSKSVTPFNKIKVSDETCSEQNPGETLGNRTTEKRTDINSLRIAAFGDYGTGGNCELAVANLVKSFDPDLIITTGDNSYISSRKLRPGPIDDNIGKFYNNYIGDYNGSYGKGSVINRFFPSVGNHDDNDGDLSVYLDYFNLPGVGANSSGNERYYDFVKGPVHFFAVNSVEETEPHGISKTSIQAQWLKQQLALSKAPWKIVYFHHSPYSSARHGPKRTLQWDFEDWGATAVLSGHDHVYERILRDDNDDNIVMPYIIVGSGGHPSMYKFSNRLVKGSRAQYNAAHGALIIEATKKQIKFTFHSIQNKGTLIDSHTIRRGARGDDGPQARVGDE